MQRSGRIAFDGEGTVTQMSKVGMNLTCSGKNKLTHVAGGEHDR
jgi:hypothetical protein